MSKNEIVDETENEERRFDLNQSTQTFVSLVRFVLYMNLLFHS